MLLAKIIVNMIGINQSIKLINLQIFICHINIVDIVNVIIRYFYSHPMRYTAYTS